MGKMKYDVIIVGAGPAGSTAAYILARRFNRKVLLIDKEVFPRDKPCGGYLTKRVFERFGYLTPDREEFTEVPTYGSYFYGPDFSRMEWIQSQPVGYLVLRTRFDDYLKNLAVSEGVKFAQGAKVVDLAVKGDEVKVELQHKDKYAGALVIGADGARSIIAKKGNMYGKSGKLSKGLCVVSEFPVPEGFLDEGHGRDRATHYFYGFQDIVGYAWLFPKRKHVNIGIGGPSIRGRELGRKFPEFLKFLIEKNLVPAATSTDTPYKAALIPTSTALYLERSCADRVLLAGDALGVASSISGEGIYQSMASGEDAAIVANESLEMQKFDSMFLQQYEKLWKKDLASELKMAGNIMQLGAQGNREDLLGKIGDFFSKMQSDKALFEFFTRAFFGIE
jgi:geranylgeranyl reductase family protein